MGKNEETTKKAIEEDVDDFAKIDDSEPKETTEAVEKKDSSLPEDEKASVDSATVPVKKSGRLKRFFSTKRGKAAGIVFAVVLIVAILLAVPTTRYGILGSFIKKDIHVMVMDSSTMKPVSQATVSVGDKNTKTDKNGEVTLGAMPVGHYTLKIAKGYYKTGEVTYDVPILSEAKEAHVSLAATGRQVTVQVTNKITNAILAGATITVNDTSAVTDDKGIAIIVLPADKKALQGMVSLDGYNKTAIEVKVTDQADANKAVLTPVGNVYYLSKQTGTINVMKSYLDGSNASVVVEGTGNENDNDTVLLAARDWNYMALSAKRDADEKKSGQLYLVDAKSGSLKTIDEGDASFQLVGWSDHRFIYIVTRNNANLWDGQTQRLKSYDAETGKLTILDEKTASGSNYYDYQSESIGYPYILDNKIVYTKVWNQGQSVSAPSDKKSAIMTVNPDGSQKQRVKEFAMQREITVNASLYQPQGIYFRVSADNVTATYYEYEGGTVKSISNTDDKFYNTAYPTYLVSPNGQKTFWSESRDGKNSLFVGDKDGKDTLALANQSEDTAYGWYGDKYVLLSKNNSELYIAAADKPFEQPLKITNFHKPAVRFPGYGYGYGGQ
ncbi:MAG: hypothetical protein JWP06_1053 [Candidatus Saccharibacteria bacterium]|nr:hypothetical protein [Candidatus Saccharibacteria bacterium]